MLRVSRTNFIRSFNRLIVCSQQSPISKPSSCSLKAPSILDHHRFKCFSTTHQRWKFVQYNKIINDGSPSPILSSSAVPFTAVSERRISSKDVQDKMKENLQHLKSASGQTYQLCLTGLGPLLLPPAYMMMTGVYSTPMALFHMSYGIALLAFQGGTFWGVLVSKEHIDKLDWNTVTLALGVAPPLIAGTAFLLPCPLAALVVMGGFSGCIYYNLEYCGGCPSSFKALQMVLSAGAILSIFAVLACKLILKTKEDKLKALCNTLEEETKNQKCKVTSDGDIV